MVGMSKDFDKLIRRNMDKQDVTLDSVNFNSLHRREIMMAQRIIDENTLCLSGVQPCEHCQDKLDNV
jgi:hypothetical protein